MINTNINSSLPLNYHTQASSPNTGDISKGFADTVLNFLAPGAQAQADWLRQEQHAENAYIRDLYSDSTKYQRTVQDMKKAGLNPSVLFGSGGASVSGTSSGSASSGETQGSQFIKELLQLGIDIGLSFITKKAVSTSNTTIGNLSKKTTTIKKWR